MRSASTVLLRTQSDARLVALARTGHDRAFEAIVERYRRPLLRACRRILPEARAEDALQQALVAAWTALRRGDEVDDVRPWLYRIVRNTALNQLRVAGYDLDELVDTLAAAEDPEEEIERRALVRQTLAAVAALPERQRDALLRTAVEGRGQDEVARDLGLTDTALRQLVHRARVSVRAAATAVVPLPAAAWLATAAPRAEPMAARIVELVAGSGAAGAATLAKAGTLAVLAGGAASAPTLVDEHPADRPARQAAKPPPSRTARSGGGGAVARAVSPLDPVAHEDDRADGARRRRRVATRSGAATTTRAGATTTTTVATESGTTSNDDDRGDEERRGDDAGRRRGAPARARRRPRRRGRARRRRSWRPAHRSSGDEDDDRHGSSDVGRGDDSSAGDGDGGGLVPRRRPRGLVRRRRAGRVLNESWSDDEPDDD